MDSTWLIMVNNTDERWLRRVDSEELEIQNGYRHGSPASHQTKAIGDTTTLGVTPSALKQKQSPYDSPRKVALKGIAELVQASFEQHIASSEKNWHVHPLKHFLDVHALPCIVHIQSRSIKMSTAPRHHSSAVIHRHNHKTYTYRCMIWNKSNPDPLHSPKIFMKRAVTTKLYDCIASDKVCKNKNHWASCHTSKSSMPTGMYDRTNCSRNHLWRLLMFPH